MIVFEAPERYRGTIEVYVVEVDDFNDATWRQTRVIEWRWRCKSRNGQILAQGEGYRRRSGALNAIDAQYGSKLVLAGGRGGSITFDGTAHYREESTQLAVVILPWRLVVRDRHGDITTTGAVY